MTYHEPFFLRGVSLTMGTLACTIYPLTWASHMRGYRLLSEARMIIWVVVSNVSHRRGHGLFGAQMSICIVVNV